MSSYALLSTHIHFADFTQMVAQLNRRNTILSRNNCYQPTSICIKRPQNYEVISLPRTVAESHPFEVKLFPTFFHVFTIELDISAVA
jgi:hypothetical protein